MPTFIIISILIAIAWYATWITVWAIGSKKQSKGMIIAGAVLTLWLIGVIIAAIQVSSINSGSRNQIELERLKLEREKFELQKQQNDKPQPKKSSAKK